MLIRSIITDRIGRLEVLLSINQTNDDKIMTKLEKENRHQLYVFIKKTTINSAKCATTSLTVYLHKYNVSTVLLHCPITGMTRTLSYYCSNRAVDNQSRSRILL